MKHVHLVGIGGSGLSAIARLLFESGYKVSGSDQAHSSMTNDLSALGVRVTIGHDPKNVFGADIVVRSSAIPENNSEILAALNAGIPVFKRAQFLKQMMTDHTVIAIAGTHGKTTTTAMIAWVLSELGQDPSYIIGGVSKNLGNNAHAGKGRLFIIEADEYDNMFLGLHPNIIVITNIEHDHPDYFPTPEEYCQAFIRFVGQMKPCGVLLACRDDTGATGLLNTTSNNYRTLSYGTHHLSAYKANNLVPNSFGGYRFDISYQQKDSEIFSLTTIDLKVPGKHNVRNALAAIAVVHQLEQSVPESARILSDYCGTSRRFDILGEVNGITVIDDYAHHPTEIQSTLAAARSRFPGQRLWAVWQPHTYSRTRTLINGFIHAFELADRVIATEIYAAREKKEPFSSSQIIQKMTHPHASFIPTLDAATDFLIDKLQTGDVLLVLSAGNADQISAGVLARLKEREKSNV